MARRIPARLRALALRWPGPLAIACSLALGAITVLNQTTFDLPSVWRTSITWTLGLTAFLVIGPRIGPRFRAAVHLPAWAATAIGVALMAAMLTAQQNTGLPERAIIIGVVQIAGGLGFAPASVPTVAV